MFSTRRVTTALALTAAATAAVLGSSAVAQDPGPRTLTLKELDKGEKFTHIRNTKSKSGRANLQGDLIAFTNPVADAAGRRKGTLHVACTTTKGSRNFLKSTMTCHGVIVLRDGSLTLQVTISPNVPTVTGAVTGGTGAYANARGVLVSKQTKSGANDTITYVVD
jgi:hypothetical protein